MCARREPDTAWPDVHGGGHVVVALSALAESLAHRGVARRLGRPCLPSRSWGRAPVEALSRTPFPDWSNGTAHDCSGWRSAVGPAADGEEYGRVPAVLRRGPRLQSDQEVDTRGQNPLVLARARHGGAHASGVRVGRPPCATHCRACWGGGGTQFYFSCALGVLPPH